MFKTMKITRRQLRQIIKEEVSRLNEFGFSRPERGPENDISGVLMAHPAIPKPIALAYASNQDVRDAMNVVLLPLWEESEDFREALMKMTDLNAFLEDISRTFF